MRSRIIAPAALLLVGLLTTTTLSAQTPNAPAGRGQGRMQSMALQGITLTPAQQAQIDSITAATRAQMPSMTPGTPPSQADREKLRSLMTASAQEVRAVLTPEQQQVYDKNLAAMKQRMEQRMQGANPPSGAPTNP